MTPQVTIDGAAQTALIALHDGDALADVSETLERLRTSRHARAVVLSIVGRPAGRASHQLLRKLELYQLPTIACFDEDLEEQAFALAMACDIRVASSETTLRAAHGRSRRLGRLVRDPLVRAKISGGDPLSARAALGCGLVSLVAPPRRAAHDALTLAAKIASRGPLATQLAKEAIWRGLDMPLEQALRFETDLTLLLQTTKDRAEGVRAFLEKREPRFTWE